jgi:UDP-N-acetylmuramoylalanine--D-glutamate ligase
VQYKNKKIAVLGLGESGEAAAVLLMEEAAMVTILDSADLKKLRSKIERITPLGIALIAGADANHDPTIYDRAVISPGVDPATPLVQNFVRKRIEMIGELELAYEFCRCPVIAITGTNGKTTTTQLVERMLNICGVRTLAAGNISPAFAAVVRKTPQLDAITLEVSSFQLEMIRTFRPHIAVWLNLAPDHLDRYASVAEYRAAKLRIFENQTADDFAVVNLRDARDLWVAQAAGLHVSAARRDDRESVAAKNGSPGVAGEPPATAREPRALPRTVPPRAKLMTFSAYETGGDFEFRNGAIFYHGDHVLDIASTNLRGLHNAENLMAALAVGLAHRLTFGEMIPPLRSYKPLPHRCELVRTLDGVDYVNDSKATNLDALEKALMSETRPVVLIAGGKDKGFEFDSITDLVAKKARSVVLIGQMADRIAGFWQARVPCAKAGSLAEAVEIARRNAQPGGVVLFSPGTSSFDMFENYIDRGDKFRAIVQLLPAT